MKKYFYKSVPFLPVKDLQKTISFYKHFLGFGNEWFWGNPPQDAGCHRDDLSLLFTLNPDLAKKMGGFELVVFVDGVDQIYKEIAGKDGVKISSPLQDEPWGIREFTVEDINGYRLRISCALERIQKLSQAN